MIHIPNSNRRPHARHVQWLVGAVALLATLFAGCTTDNGNSATLASNQTFVYANTGGGPLVEPNFDPTDDSKDVGGLSIDPAFALDVYSSITLNMIQMQLVTFDNSLNIIPDGASSWKRSADGKTWTFTLRPGLEWSDGTPLTAADFKAGMLHALDPNLCTEDSPLIDPDPAMQQPCVGGQPLSFYLSYIQGAGLYSSGKAKDISGIQTPDAQTIVFQLTDPISFFLDDLATAASMPLETAVYNQYKGHFIDHYAEGKAQSGPFMVKSWFNLANPSDTKPTDSTEIKLTPNPHWWGKKPTLTEVDMPLIVSQDDSYQQYVDGKLDYTLVPSHQFPFAQDLPDFHAVNAFTIDYFGINQLIAPFNNQQVRQAFDLALNKQLLVDNVFLGARTPTNHIIPQGIPGYNLGLLNPPDNTASAALTGNQDKAQQLITQVASQCITNYSQSWCPSIIGKSGSGATLQSVRTVTGNNACPDYKVFATLDSANNWQSTQSLVTVYAPTGNPDRIKMAQNATQEWLSGLCLNLVEKTIPKTTLFGDIGQMANHAPIKPEGIWTIGYGADYPDPQDFTTNQFSPTSGNNSANIGFNGGDAALESQMHQADIEQDPTKRYQDYQQIEQVLVDDVAWIPFDQSLFTYRVRTYVVNFSVPQDTVIPDQSWSNIFLVAH